MNTRPKVLFANPPWWVTRERVGLLKRRWRVGVRAGSRWPFTFLAKSAPDAPVFGDYAPYPFFMGYAATYAARETDAEIFLRDSIALRESTASFHAYVDELRPDVFFLESATPSWDHDSALLVELAGRYPDMRIVVTGPIASVRPEKLLADFPLFSCIQGEYEKGAVRAIEGQDGVHPHDLLTEEEMNGSPFPWFDDVIAHRYADKNPRGQLFPHAQVWSSRGCPFKCIFCVWPATMTGNDPEGNAVRKVRHYTPEYMENFLGEIVARYGFQSIYFDDDTFNLGNRHVEGMCEVMGRIGLPWSAMCRADTIKFETWKTMKEAGCFGVKLGFESGNQYVVDQIINKHLDLDFARRVVEEIRSLGMTVHGTFTYGLPGETAAQMHETKDFIASLDLDTIQESGTAEIEGTPLHTLREKGHLDAYKGARIDDEYRHEVDGNVKFQQLAQKLREG